MYFLITSVFTLALILFLKNIGDVISIFASKNKLERDSYCREFLAKDQYFDLKIMLSFILLILLIYVRYFTSLKNNDFIFLVLNIILFYMAISLKKIICLIIIKYNDLKRKAQVTNHSGSKTPSFIIHILLAFGALLLCSTWSTMGNMLGFWLLVIVIPSLIGELIAIIKKSIDNKKILQIDNSIYLRELPNNYGIGVNSLLIDSNIENDKDITAVILDLCAKGYLSIRKENDKYIVKVLKNIDNYLLNNEKYILENIINNNIKNIDYQIWYDLCVEDGKNLNFYVPVKKKKTLKDIIIDFLKKINSIQWNPLIVAFLGIFVLIIMCICLLVLLVLAFVYLLYRLFCFPFVIINSYNTEINNNLKRTDNGIVEYRKLMAFRNFIKDFGAFADREAKEVVIWDRYLSYAQVFGLTKEIMQTGYKELIDNASFQIDNIDNISLDNIEILK